MFGRAVAARLERAARPFGGLPERTTVETVLKGVVALVGFVLAAWLSVPYFLTLWWNAVDYDGDMPFWTIVLLRRVGLVLPVLALECALVAAALRGHLRAIPLISVFVFGAAAGVLWNGMGALMPSPRSVSIPVPWPLAIALVGLAFYAGLLAASKLHLWARRGASGGRMRRQWAVFTLAVAPMLLWCAAQPWIQARLGEGDGVTWSVPARVAIAAHIWIGRYVVLWLLVLEVVATPAALAAARGLAHDEHEAIRMRVMIWAVVCIAVAAAGFLSLYADKGSASLIFAAWATEQQATNVAYILCLANALALLQGSARGTIAVLVVATALQLSLSPLAALPVPLIVGLWRARPARPV